MHRISRLEVKSNREIWGKDFAVGDEWDAGASTGVLAKFPAGRWTVRREEDGFVVVYHQFHDGKENVLEKFPPTEQGEIDAKVCALEARDTDRIVSTR